MASGPNTLNVLQSIQYRIFTEVLVSSASPFTSWALTPNPDNPGSVSDYTRFGTNRQGQVTTAIYIGMPKVPNPNYPVQCHIIPPFQGQIYRKSMGGKVFDEQSIYIRFLSLNVGDWYDNQISMMALRDVAVPMIQRHAEMPGGIAPTASKEMPGGNGMPTGYNRVEVIGREWDTWGFVWWVRQEYTLTDGFVT